MTSTRLRLAAAILVLPASACAGAAHDPARIAQPASRSASDTAGALQAQRDWWRAFAIADTAYVGAHTAPELALTLSSGRTFDRAAMLRESASHTAGARLRLEWAEEAVQAAAPGLAVVTTRVTESEGTNTQSFRYLTTLVRHGAGWRVAAAQSTRIAGFTPRVPATTAGRLADFVGDYRTPRGAVLRIVAQDSALALIEPSGAELRIEPVGPGLFEFTELSPSNGIVRFAFTRDASGAVVAFSRLVPGAVNTFPRIR
jgi:hypothetical protein